MITDIERKRWYKKQINILKIWILACWKCFNVNTKRANAYELKWDMTNANRLRLENKWTYEYIISLWRDLKDYRSLLYREVPKPIIKKIPREESKIWNRYWVIDRYGDS